MHTNNNTISAVQHVCAGGCDRTFDMSNSVKSDTQNWGMPNLQCVKFHMSAPFILGWGERMWCVFFSGYRRQLENVTLLYVCYVALMYPSRQLPWQDFGPWFCHYSFICQPISIINCSIDLWSVLIHCCLDHWSVLIDCSLDSVSVLIHCFMDPWGVLIHFSLDLGSVHILIQWVTCALCRRKYSYFCVLW